VIFVITGTNGPPFDRLMRAVETLDADEEILVQPGPSAIRPVNARCTPYFSLQETVEHIKNARLVVSHGGVGSVLNCLANGKRPLVVPRRSCYGEVTDDHQIPFGRRLDREGLVVFVPRPEELAEAIRSQVDADPVTIGAGEALVDDLRLYVQRIRPRPAPVARG